MKGGGPTASMGWTFARREESEEKAARASKLRRALTVKGRRRRRASGGSANNGNMAGKRWAQCRILAAFWTLSTIGDGASRWNLEGSIRPNEGMERAWSGITTREGLQHSALS